MGFFTKVVKLFSAPANGTKTGSKVSYPSEQYKGFTITPQPMDNNGQYRIAGLIEKAGAEGEALKQHHFIRSDTVANADQAADLTIVKCKIFIDQMGDSIFD